MNLAIKHSLKYKNIFLIFFRYKIVLHKNKILPKVLYLLFLKFRLYKARMIRTLIWAIMSSLLYRLSYSLNLCGQRICTSNSWSWARYVTITSIHIIKIHLIKIHLIKIHMIKFHNIKIHIIKIKSSK